MGDLVKPDERSISYGAKGIVENLAGGRHGADDADFPLAALISQRMRGGA